MNVALASGGDEHGKFAGVVRAFPHVWEGAVLDVGCRSGILRRALPSLTARYVGLDLCRPAQVLSDLGTGLPFSDQSFDTVTALDVLEHTDDFHRSFQELCRVARRYIVISLPNAYELRARLKFLLGRRTSGKYGLPLETAGDRHRWLFSLREASQFCRVWSGRCGFAVEAECSLIGPRRSRFPQRLLVQRWPNLFTQTYLVLLRSRRAG